MSRSNGAWTESWAAVRAVVHGADVPGRRRERLLVVAASFRRPYWLVTTALLVLALAPASALARSSRTGAARSPITPIQRRSHRVHSGHRVVDVRRPRAGGPSPTRRLAEAALLAPGAGYYGSERSALVRLLQRRLVAVGDPPGPIDGLYGPLTESAVAQFQAAHGLVVDGIAGPATLAALAVPVPVLYPGAGYLQARGSVSVRGLQRRLAGLGFAPGPIDGRYGPRTEQAVSRFQAARGLEVDGIAGPQTLAHLGVQRTVREATRPSPPVASHHQASRSSHSGRSRRYTSQRRPGRAPAPRKVVRVSHATNSPSTGLLVLLIALAVALGLSATWFAVRRRTERYASVDAAANGASRSEPADATAVNSGQSTTQEVATPDSATIPIPDPREPDDAGRVFRHALLLEEHGDEMGAVAAYRRADRLGHDAAAVHLGVLLEQHGDTAAAEAAYRRAAQRGDADGAFNLAILLEEQGNPTEAVGAYRRADGLGHGAAAANLGVLLEQYGDTAAAEAAYRRADQRGDPTGAINLAILLEEQGDQIGALRAYQRAGELGQPAIAEAARAAALELTRQIQRPAAAPKEGGQDGS